MAPSASLHSPNSEPDSPEVRAVTPSDAPVCLATLHAVLHRCIQQLMIYNGEVCELMKPVWGGRQLFLCHVHVFQDSSIKDKPAAAAICVLSSNGVLDLEISQRQSCPEWAITHCTGTCPDMHAVHARILTLQLRMC